MFKHNFFLNFTYRNFFPKNLYLCNKKNYRKLSRTMLNDDLKFDNRVAIVTGAGGGLGREYALLLASRGASIVVNDLGGGRAGEGKNSQAADEVVQLIQNKGGKAVADYNSVDEGEKIVKTAIESFGRIDIVINNAGILRDKSFLKITKEDWELVHRVHLYGSFSVSKAAWPYFREQSYGRIVMTCSDAGIFGNFGQSNYSSAKLGLLGLSNTLSVEGAKYNIHCNTIIPVAGSRLTEDVLPGDLFEQLKPKYVAPVVAWLCHEKCEDNGSVIESAGGWVGKYRWQRAKGKTFIPPDKMSIESVANNWGVITNMESSSYPQTIHEQMSLLVTSLASKGESEDLSKGISYSFTEDEAILYALSVGVSTLHDDHLKFLYENDENFSVIPTFGVIPMFNSIFNDGLVEEALKGVNISFDPAKILHGEHYLEVLNTIPTAGTLFSKPYVIDVLDKGSGALILLGVDTYDESRNKIFYNQLSIFQVGSGNFGGKRISESPEVKYHVNVPNRPPDSFFSETTSSDQAALYRLCGDKNPLHIDPTFSIIGGFEKPILHGLCTLGYAARHVLKQYANNNPLLFKSMKVRFSSTIIPGQTITTHMWKQGNRIHFESFCEETGKKVISGGYIDLKSDLYDNATSGYGSNNFTEVENANEYFAAPYDSPSIDYMMAHSDSSLGGSDGNSNECKADHIFDKWLSQRIDDMKDLIPVIKTVYQWNITKNGKVASVWTCDFKNGSGAVYRGSPRTGKADCSLTLDDDLVVKLFNGKQDAMKAFMSGQLKISGNILAAQKLQQLWSEDSLREDIGKIEVPSSDVQDTEDVDLKSIPVSGLLADLAFNVLQNRAHEEPDFMKRLRVIFQFNVLKDGKPACVWTADNKTKPEVTVYREAPKGVKPECIVTMEDADMLKVITGKMNPQRLFMMGKVKVKGNIMLLQKLNALWMEFQKLGKAPEFPLIVDTLLKEPLKPGLKSESVMMDILQRIVKLPELTHQIPGCYLFNITKDGKIVNIWTLSLLEVRKIYRGEPIGEKPKCIIEIDDDDLARLVFKKITIQDALSTGKIKVEGDKESALKLHKIFITPTSLKPKL